MPIERISPRGADVEIIEPTPSSFADPPCIKPTRIRVNGTDVGLIKRDSVHVDTGAGGEPATVTLTLQVHSLTIRADPQAD